MKVKRFASKAKIAASLLLAVGLVSASQAASTYTVHGTQSYSIDAITDPVESGGLGATLTQNPNPPTFSGSWNIDAAAPSLAGSFIFAPYTVLVDFSPAPFGQIDLNIPNRVLTLSGGSYSYDATTRTLSATGITFLGSSPGATCSDGGTFNCDAIPGTGASGHGSLTLTFAADLLSFNGVANVHQVVTMLVENPWAACRAEGGPNLCANNTLTFSGVAAVPVPAAAWLFGSAVLGLVGLKRSKAA
jgi:hypothetical protein